MSTRAHGPRAPRQDCDARSAFLTGFSRMSRRTLAQPSFIARVAAPALPSSCTVLTRVRGIGIGQRGSREAHGGQSELVDVKGYRIKFWSLANYLNSQEFRLRV